MPHRVTLKIIKIGNQDGKESLEKRELLSYKDKKTLH